MIRTKNAKDGVSKVKVQWKGDFNKCKKVHQWLQKVFKITQIQPVLYLPQWQEKVQKLQDVQLLLATWPMDTRKAQEKRKNVKKLLWLAYDSLPSLSSYWELFLSNCLQLKEIEYKINRFLICKLIIFVYNFVWFVLKRLLLFWGLFLIFPSSAFKLSGAGSFDVTLLLLFRLFSSCSVSKGITIRIQW